MLKISRTEMYLEAIHASVRVSQKFEDLFRVYRLFILDSRHHRLRFVLLVCLEFFFNCSDPLRSLWSVIASWNVVRTLCSTTLRTYLAGRRIVSRSRNPRRSIPGVTDYCARFNVFIASRRLLRLLELLGTGKFLPALPILHGFLYPRARRTLHP